MGDCPLEHGAMGNSWGKCASFGGGVSTGRHASRWPP